MFLLLIILPHSWIYWLLNLAKRNTVQPIAVGFKYATLLSFFLVIILFWDSFRGMAAAVNASHDEPFVTADTHQREKIKELYNQRNFYLCGFTLFTSLVLNRYFNLLVKYIELQQTKPIENSKKSQLLIDL